MSSLKKLGLYKLDSTKMTKILGGTATGSGYHSGNGQVASFSFAYDSTNGSSTTYYTCSTIDAKQNQTVFAPGSNVVLSSSK
jgi:hypothetical protein